jgi:hypothetical protein
MKSQPPRDDERGRVISFRPRVPRARDDNRHWPRLLRPQVPDLGNYERRRDVDDYRQRMANNLLAFLLLCLLVGCGIWLANAMADMRAGLDCALTGRTTCGPIRLPPAKSP